MREEIIATIPQTQREDQVLEVAITYDAADRARIELRDLTWANGIGWHRQKTLSLDASDADALLKSLGQARRRLHPREPAHEGGKVIPLPLERRAPGSARPSLALECRAEGMKKACCERFKRKGKACKKCPTMAALSTKSGKKLLKVSQKR